jgi:very-short-patch-repair endonuclease
MREILDRLEYGRGVIDRRTNRDLSGPLDRALRNGQLMGMLPGIYCLPSSADNVDIRILAALTWSGAGAVLTGWAAARWTFWPGVTVPVVSVALTTTGLRGRPWLRLEHRHIPDELVCHRGRWAVTRPSLTAVDLADSRSGGAVIDQVLRTRSGTLDQMWAALESTPHRRGNALRTRMLTESRHEPWSELERDTHTLLDSAGFSGWITNAPVLEYLVDILFRAERLVVELDGWEVHGTRFAFEADRRRRNQIEAAGYRVLNFTARQVRDDPQWVIEIIRRALGR